MTVCPKCNGRGTVGYFHIDHFVDIECDRCNGSGEVEMTNEEWFASLPTEEKAKWIAEEKMCRGYFIFPSMEEAIQDALEWLKEKHE